MGSAPTEGGAADGGGPGVPIGIWGNIRTRWGECWRLLEMEFLILLLELHGAGCSD